MWNNDRLFSPGDDMYRYYSWTIHWYVFIDGPPSNWFLVVLDVSKAFDKVYHPSFLFVFNMFLEDRKQKVVIDCVSSDLNGINASVPQGSKAFDKV